MIDAKQLANMVREEDGDEHVTPRTVHYYTQLGILPPALGRGKGAFTLEHLARFRMARQLRREGLSLSQIREAVGQASRKTLDGFLTASSLSTVQSQVFPPPPPQAAPSSARFAGYRAGGDNAGGIRSSLRSLRFRGGFALQVPEWVLDEEVARIYARVERVLERETSHRRRQTEVSGDE